MFCCFVDELPNADETRRGNNLKWSVVCVRHAYIMSPYFREIDPSYLRRPILSSSALNFHIASFNLVFVHSKCTSDMAPITIADRTMSLTPGIINGLCGTNSGRP